jgi:hypothetical protein
MLWKSRNRRDQITRRIIHRGSFIRKAFTPSLSTLSPFFPRPTKSATLAGSVESVSSGSKGMVMLISSPSSVRVFLATKLKMILLRW